MELPPIRCGVRLHDRHLRGRPRQTEKNNNALRWDIHFWLGKNTSQDEAGVAAYKTVELDDSLGGAAIQHRETEGAESQAFLSLFQPFGGVKYAEGGVESGFKKVNRDEYEKRLLQVKGKRNVRISPVEISYKSLNNGDVFILDCGLKIFQWNGKSSSKAERAKVGTRQPSGRLPGLRNARDPAPRPLPAAPKPTANLEGSRQRRRRYLAPVGS